MSEISRRNFLEAGVILAGVTALDLEAATFATQPKKALEISMLPQKLSMLDRFKLAAELGFAGIEMETLANPRSADEVKEASLKSGVKVHSVMNMDHWKYPLSSGDSEVVKKSVQGMITSLRNAKLWGADTVLLVPAVVTPQVSYQQAYTRYQKAIREQLLPLAHELQIVIGIEEVWNKFLLSPLEFARYVDEFQSPWVRAYLDVGNMLLFGYPEDWIRTLGKRIVKVHLKDFAMDQANDKFYWKNLGEGDVNWAEVRKALDEIGYNGFVTLEIDGGDASYLKDVSRRVDRFLAGEAKLTA